MDWTRLTDAATAAGIFDHLLPLLAPKQECYLVGGALRDALLGRSSADFDFATSFDPTPLARHFARRAEGHWFFLDSERNQSRVVMSHSGITCDFAPFRGPDLTADLLLRDYTINALALPLSPWPADLIDPLGGQDDLQRRILRDCSPSVLTDDPLRVLKGVRHCAVLALIPEASTVKRMARAAPQITRIAPERIRSEVAAIFAAPGLTCGLQWLQRLGLLELLFGPSGEAGSFAQGRLLAERAEAVIRSTLTRDAQGRVRDYLATELEAGLTHATMLKLGAFLRGYCPLQSERILLGLRLSRASRRTLKVLLTLAADQLNSINNLPPRPRPRALWAQQNAPAEASALLLLAVLAPDPAEALNRIWPVLNDLLLMQSQGPLSHLVNGRWITTHLDISDGPAVGAALQRVRQAEIAGEIQTTEEAQQFLRAQRINMIDKT